MNDKLKPNQEKRVIENFVECIMDDLDYYHFDELIIEKYKKELFQFFTKISEEHSLFSPGFDFSNKKSIVNDKEKIKEASRMIDDLERFADHLDGQLTWMTTKELKKSLQKIRDILEK